MGKRVPVLFGAARERAVRLTEAGHVAACRPHAASRRAAVQIRHMMAAAVGGGLLQSLPLERKGDP